MNENYAINDVSLKLMHYLITVEDYKPIMLHGAVKEIWLENFTSNFKIIRISFRPIRNVTQVNEDLSRTNRIMNSIKAKTMSLSMNILNIYLDCDELPVDKKNIHSVVLQKDNDGTYDVSPLYNVFPSLEDQNYAEEKVDLYAKLTIEINDKNKENAKKSNELFGNKTPYLTYVFAAINVLLFLSMELLGGGSTNGATLIEYGALYNPLVRAGDYYRLFSPIFLHIGFAHLAFNTYALIIIGKYIENFYGKFKYFIIYIFSGFLGNLLSFLLVDNLSAGASGAIFGLLGAYIVFGYHYRIVLGKSLRYNILPVLVVNLVLGFILPGINDIAHLGGLIGGILISLSVGVKYTSKWYTRLNATLATILLVLSLIYIGFFEKEVYTNKSLDKEVIRHYEENMKVKKYVNYNKKINQFESR